MDDSKCAAIQSTIDDLVREIRAEMLYRATAVSSGAGIFCLVHESTRADIKALVDKIGCLSPDKQQQYHDELWTEIWSMFDHLGCRSIEGPLCDAMSGIRKFAFLDEDVASAALGSLDEFHSILANGFDKPRWAAERIYSNLHDLQTSAPLLLASDDPAAVREKFAEGVASLESSVGWEVEVQGAFGAASTERVRDIVKQAVLLQQLLASCV